MLSTHQSRASPLQLTNSKVGVARVARPVRTKAAAVEDILVPDGNLVTSSDAPVQIRKPLPQFRILYKDEHIVAIDKPRGFYVHPREDGRPTPPEENALWLLKKQLKGKWLWPVHRLDRATSGVVLYCLTQEAAQEFGKSMRAKDIRKSYVALVRGYTPTYGKIDDPVGGQASCTVYETLARCNIPLKVGKWPGSRYSLIRAEPLTGRFHQIRRHMNYVSHPIVGDSDHGDRYHNRAFIHQLGLKGMYLRAASVQFHHPFTAQPITVSVDSWEDRWVAAFDMFGTSPYTPPTSTSPYACTPIDEPSVLEYQCDLITGSVDHVLRHQQRQAVILNQGLQNADPRNVRNPMLSAQLHPYLHDLGSSSDSDTSIREAGMASDYAALHLHMSEPIPRSAPLPRPPVIAADSAVGDDATTNAD